MVSYPLTMPTSPAPVRSTIRLIRKTAVAESPFTGQQQVYSHPYAIWQMEISLPPMLPAQAGAWKAFILQLSGRKGTFLAGDPDMKLPRGTATGATINGASQTGNVITVSGMVNTTLLKGDYIQIGQRLHMVCNDHGGGGTGVTILEIEPALRSSPANGSSVIVQNPKGLWRLASDDIGWDSDHVRRHAFTIACVEAL
jgi:hypothetical protein